MTNPSQKERADTPGVGSRLSDDQFYDALSSRTRRRSLYYLLESGQTSTEELATVLTGWDAGETGRPGTPADRDRRRTALHHNHLPLLEAADLVAWDRERGTVSAESLDAPAADIVRRSVESERS